MATIRPNENAPAEDVNYILPTETFELGADGSFESDDPAVLAAALAHPWLAVEYSEQESVVYEAPRKSIAPEDDPYSGYHSIVNDPEAVREVEEAKVASFDNRLAVEAGLDQKEPVEEAGVSRTLADYDYDTSDDSTDEEEIS